MSKKKFSRNKQEKIELIYKTFFNLILKQGYHKVSTNHVAKSAKISIGTIYKYFPNGKEDIIKKYFEVSMENMLERDELSTMNNNNMRDFIDHFIIDLFNNHEENLGYNLAFRSAIQSDITLHEDHKRKITQIFKERAQKLRTINQTFNHMPEEKLIELFTFLYNLINAILYHHLSIMKLFNTKNELIEYLSELVVFSVKYLMRG